MPAIFLNLPDHLEPIPITNLFDSTGEEVDSWEEAAMFVAGPLPDGKWLSAPVAEYRITEPN